MTDFYQVGGSLKPDSTSYIESQADETLYEALKRGQFCYVLNSRKMGKSSLWVQTQKQLTEEGVRCVTVDLTKIGKPNFEETWYRIFFYELVKSFDVSIKNQRQAWWDERKELTPINRLTEFIEDVLLQEIEEDIVICLGDIDSIFCLNFASDAFFTWIRSLYNQRSNKPIYNRLTVCILGVALISDLIRDVCKLIFESGTGLNNANSDHELDTIPPYIEKYQEWLNSGLDKSRLLSGQNLRDALDWSEDKSLNPEEVRYLKISQMVEKQKAQKSRQQEAYQIAQGIFASEFSDELQQILIEEILVWTGNQSELTIIVCKLVIEYKNLLRKGEEKEFIEQLIQEHIIENWQQKEAAEHLTEMQNRLLATDDDLKIRLETYKDILQGRLIYSDNPQNLALLETELVINNDDWLEVANGIYKEVFNVKWVNEELEKMDAVENQPAPLTSIASYGALIAFITITIVWLVFKPKNDTTIERPTSSLPEICTQRDFSISLEDNIQKLQILQNQQTEDFPSECDTQLTELNLIKQAIELGRSNYVAQAPTGEGAIKILCDIPEDSNSIEEAQFWAKRWYNDNSWKKEIDQVLQDDPECKKKLIE